MIHNITGYLSIHFSALVIDYLWTPVCISQDSSSLLPTLPSLPHVDWVLGITGSWIAVWKTLDLAHDSGKTAWWPPLKSSVSFSREVGSYSSREATANVFKPGSVMIMIRTELWKNITLTAVLKCLVFVLFQ